MTLPAERTRSLIRTANFLRALMDPKKIPGVPKNVREEARSCLRHHPGLHDLLVLAEADAKSTNLNKTLDVPTIQGEMQRRDAEWYEQLRSDPALSQLVPVLLGERESATREQAANEVSPPPD